MALFIISLVLLTQTLYCYYDPENYPYQASELTRGRYDSSLAPSERQVFSIPAFLKCYVNSKTNYVITLTSLEKVEVTCTVTSYLTNNSIPLNLEKVYLLSIGTIDDLTVNLNGQTLTPFLTDINGSKCYTAKGFNLTDTSQVKTLETSFNIE